VKLGKIIRLPRRKRRMLDRIEGFDTVIGPESIVAGTFRGKDNLLVHGRVTGQSDLNGTFMLAAGGEWLGDIVADNVVIAGQVEGDVTARTRLELAATARIRGKLRSPAIAIAEGAVYEGRVDMARDTQLTHYNERRTKPKPS
jgi:cytoskeletal protein CcmA (bactofilin family)